MKSLKLPNLNLPEIAADIIWKDEIAYVKDFIRHKYLVLTPEEWVRQHFIHLLVEYLNYPKALINIEKGNHYLNSQKRTDIHVFDRKGKISLLVECKAAHIPLTSSTIEQISIYNQNYHATCLAITNGMKHYVWQKSADLKSYKQLSYFPEFT